MAKGDFPSNWSHYDIVDAWPTDGLDHNSTLSTVTDLMGGGNWTTTGSKRMDLDDCGPSEYIFIFYAYYYGLMMLVTMIGVVGNTAVIRLFFILS